MKPLPFQKWPAHKPTKQNQTPIYFAHANAYPPASYQTIIDGLRDHGPVISYLQRPLWPEPPAHSTVKTWHDYADDVTQFFDQQNIKNAVAVGHSMGAVTAFLAASKRPDLIKALVMIEPVVFSRAFCWLNRIMPDFVRRRVAIINKTLNRPDVWPTQKAAFNFHRRTRAFKRVSDTELWHYIKAGTFLDQADEGQAVYRLTFDKFWEAHNYQTVTPFRKQLMTSKLPVMAMRGGYTDTIPDGFWQKWHSNPNHQLIEMNKASHLLPLEQPETVLQTMSPFLQKHL